MRTKRLGKTDLRVSIVALGTWPMGGTTYVNGHLRIPIFGHEISSR